MAKVVENQPVALQEAIKSQGPGCRARRKGMIKEGFKGRGREHAGGSRQEGSVAKNTTNLKKLFKTLV